MDWTYYKNLGSWPLQFQQDRPYYNEGDRISSSDNPVWTTDFTKRPVTPTHAPWCGYWHDHPVEDYDKGLEFPSDPYYPYIICQPDPNLRWDSAISAEVISPGASATIGVIGANYPFKWEVSGYAFSLQYAETEGATNTLIAGSGACGSAEITVTGCDGVQIVEYVRSIIGQWTSSTAGCKLKGVIGTVTLANPNPGHPYSYNITKTSGRWKQSDSYVGSMASWCQFGNCAGDPFDCLEGPEHCKETYPVDLDSWCRVEGDINESYWMYVIVHYNSVYSEWVC